MNTDTVQDHLNGALVARQNRSNSIDDLNQNPLPNGPTDSALHLSVSSDGVASHLSNSSIEDYKSDALKQRAINHAETVSRPDDLEKKDHSANQDDSRLNDVDGNGEGDSELKCPSNRDNHVDEENEAIHKLGLSLDYHPQTNLVELEQSFASLNSSAAFNKSETGSTHSASSRANSPSRASQHSLPFPPKSIRRDTSETNLLVSELEPRSHEEQVRYFRIERTNLLHLSSLIINNLIKTISPLTKTLECHDNVVLYDFFSITELILRHGLKSRKGLIFGKKELWNVLESIENRSVQNTEIMQNIRELPNVKYVGNFVI